MAIFAFICTQNTLETVRTSRAHKHTSGHHAKFSGTDLHVTERSLRNTEYGLPNVFRVTFNYIRAIQYV